MSKTSKKNNRVYYCGRCKKRIGGKVFYRYPHVFENPESNSVKDAIWYRLMVFCEPCMKIFDKNSDAMRAKYMYRDNKKLIKFYEQYL